MCATTLAFRGWSFRSAISPETIAGSQARDLLAVADHVDPARSDRVEGVPGLSLRHDDLAGRRVDPLPYVIKLPERLGARVSERGMLTKLRHRLQGESELGRVDRVGKEPVERASVHLEQFDLARRPGRGGPGRRLKESQLAEGGRRGGGFSACSSRRSADAPSRSRSRALADDVERIASVPCRKMACPARTTRSCTRPARSLRTPLGQVLERRQRIDQLRRLHPATPDSNRNRTRRYTAPYAAPQAPYQSDGRADQGSGHEYGEQEQDEPRQESAVPQRLHDPAELGSPEVERRKQHDHREHRSQQPVGGRPEAPAG